MDNAESLELLKVRDHQKCKLERDEQQNAVIACQEALLNLDNAADNLLQLFSRLGTLTNGEEVSGGSEAQLYSEAIEMLPSMATKVHAVAKLVESTCNPGGKTEVGISSFEHLPGTFAESVSQKVVELLKTNCNTI
ncbi:hypothetical protein Acr_02g0005540 [Actinidia rufa]|uniref:Uncharacterized protein n=1 Tax=Actinidia rufa TaxID=165716 RepID=A0A7J0E750_9ERIC|nr:hypothetical protein Acr_02g0005540 [Actinidia rufa]